MHIHRLHRKLNCATTLGIAFILSFAVGYSSTAFSPAASSSSNSPSNSDKLTSLSQVLDDINTYPDDRTITELRSIRKSGNLNNQQLEQTAYILARLLQKQAVPSSNNDQQTSNQAILEEALSLFTEAAQREPLWERCQWHIAEVGAFVGKEKNVRAALNAIIERTKDKEKITAAQYGLAQSYIRSHETDKSRELFLRIRKEAPSTEFARGSAYYLGVIDLATKDPNSIEQNRTEAISLFHSYLNASPGGHFAQEIIDSLQDLAKNNSYQMTANDHEIFGTVQFLQNNYKQALAEWVQGNTNEDQFRKAIAFYRTGQIDEAEKQLLGAIKSNPEDTYANTAALICQGLTRAKATALWQSILDLNPTHSDSALWNIAVRSEPAEAQENFRALIQKFPTSEHAPEAAWWIFWREATDACNNKAKITSAIKFARSEATRYPKTKAAARLWFWSGKLSEKLGKKEEARADYAKVIAEFPSNYYAYRSRQRLEVLSQHGTHKDRGWSIRISRPTNYVAWSWPIPHLATPVELSELYGPTISELAQLHQFDECLTLLPPKASYEVKAWLFVQQGLVMDAINTAVKNATGTPKFSIYWQYAYPLGYANDIAHDSKLSTIDPFLVHALVREESRYNPNAVSRSNAIGLTQLMPATAYGVAKRLSIPLSGNQDIFKPENNLRMGTDYLAYAVRRFSGNALLGVASYNGGPGAVQSWQRQQAGQSDLDVFVENIPVTETRDYVRKVFGAYWNYELIYGKKI
jgi:TolA-binding protein